MKLRPARRQGDFLAGGGGVVPHPPGRPGPGPHINSAETSPPPLALQGRGEEAADRGAGGQGPAGRGWRETPTLPAHPRAVPASVGPSVITPHGFPGCG